MRTVIRKLKDKRGSGELIGGVMVIIAAVIGTVLILSAAALAPRAVAAYTAAHEIAGKIASDGQYGGTEQQYVTDYLNQAKLTATVSCDRSGVIQLGQTFSVTLTTRAVVGVGSIGKVTIPIPVKVAGRSKVYTAGY